MSERRTSRANRARSMFDIWRYFTAALGIGRVLVVDDDRDLCDLLSDFLSEEGYDVTRAYAGQDAIDAVRSSVPDAVLLDLLLPDMSGVAVARALRDAASTRDVPIVIISGDRVALARSQGEVRADAFLEKPFSLAAVESAVRGALGPRNGTHGAA
jgi:DNA-binding response OmpR family regulator